MHSAQETFQTLSLVMHNSFEGTTFVCRCAAKKLLGQHW